MHIDLGTHFCNFLVLVQVKLVSVLARQSCCRAAAGDEVQTFRRLSVSQRELRREVEARGGPLADLPPDVIAEALNEPGGAAHFEMMRRLGLLDDD